MNTHFRKATIKDIDSLIPLLHQLFSLEIEFKPDYNIQRQALLQILEDEKIGEIFIIEVDNKIIGMINLLYTVSTALGERVALLEDMIIDMNYRDKGYGSLLIDNVKNYINEKNIKRITLLTDDNNHKAHTFYEKHNFTKSSMIPFRLHL